MCLEALSKRLMRRTNIDEQSLSGTGTQTSQSYTFAGRNQGAKWGSTFVAVSVLGVLVCHPVRYMLFDFGPNFLQRDETKVEGMWWPCDLEQQMTKLVFSCLNGQSDAVRGTA